MRAQVEHPSRMLRRTPVGADHGVLALVLDTHEPVLVQLARLRADVGHDDDRLAPQCVRLRTARRLELLGLLARPARRARRVLAFERHVPSSIVVLNTTRMPRGYIPGGLRTPGS